MEQRAYEADSAADERLRLRDVHVQERRVSQPAGQAHFLPDGYVVLSAQDDLRDREGQPYEALRAAVDTCSLQRTDVSSGPSNHICGL